MLCSCGVCSRTGETENGVCLKLSILCAFFDRQRSVVSAEKPSNDRGEEEIRGGEETPLTPYVTTTGKRRRLSLDSSEDARPIKTLKPALDDDDDDDEEEEEEESDYTSSDEESSEDEGGDEDLDPEQLREKILEYRAEKEALLRERARLELKLIRMEAEQAIIMKIGL